MPIFSESYLQRLIEEAEEVISTRIPCIFKRFSLAVTQGTSTYTISNNVLRILQIAYKSRIIDPQEIRDYRGDSWFKPQNLGNQGQPQFYSRVGAGFDQIMFYPIPNESITADDSVIDTDAGMNTKVILSVYVAANVNSTTDRLPTYLFRNIMKFYAMAEAFKKEGPSQSLIASGYYDKKFEIFMQTYSNIINKVPQVVELQFGPEFSNRNGRPPRPVLPSTGKWSF